MSVPEASPDETTDGDAEGVAKRDPDEVGIRSNLLVDDDQEIENDDDVEHTLSAMLSGLKFFASGETTPPMLSKAICTSSPNLAFKESTRARWADLTIDRETRSATGSL